LTETCGMLVVFFGYNWPPRYNQNIAVIVENHWPATNHWQTLLHNVVSSTPRLSVKCSLTGYRNLESKSEHSLNFITQWFMSCSHFLYSSLRQSLDYIDHWVFIKAWMNLHNTMMIHSISYSTFITGSQENDLVTCFLLQST
jgi:hypothetical protein